MPAPTYAQRRADFAHRAATARTRYDRLTWVRLLSFVVGVGLVALLYTLAWWVGLLATIAFLAGFYRFVQWHQAIQEQADHLDELARVNAREHAVVSEHDYQAFADGAAWRDPDHPNAVDLDLFGPYSLFQFLNRTRTALGAARLADYLLAPAPTPTVQERQARVAALAPLLDWRQELIARGAELQDSAADQERLRRWLEQPDVVADRPALVAALWAVPLFMIAVIVLWITLIPWQVALLALLVPGLILRKHLPRITAAHEYTARIYPVLRGYGHLLAHLEQTPTENPALQALFAPLHAGHEPARAIRQLGYRLGQLDVRFNVFSFLLEFTGFWSLQWLYQLDQWRQTHREALPQWFAVLAETEALASVANLHYNRPEWVFPTITTEPHLQAAALGHPLLDPRVRVDNDIEITTRGHIHLVTGSNMAGKSTWLRTVGSNIVLALAGAPVCARTMELPQLQVYSSMRTQDALHESTSSFFAELKRLKVIIDAVEDPTLTAGRPVFFLLDEILKGTNSRDRHTGARALIRQLIRSQGAGIIATHDLELAALESEAGSRVENWAMEVRIDDGNLDFDYTLHRGVSQSFNATLLMRRMGIRIPEEEMRSRGE
jgi:hypothetical protein